MQSLIMNRRDVDFMLYEWLDTIALVERPHFADHSRGSFEAALDAYEKVAREFFAPHNKKNDQSEPHFDGERVSVNPEIQRALEAFSSVGLMAARHAYDLGGMQLPTVVERAGMAFMLAANAGTAGYAFLTIAAADLILTHGSQTQIDDFARKMLEGRYFGTMCLSEPHAGSSLADIKTRAIRADDGSYRLTGNKMWISGGDQEISENIVHMVLAKIAAPDGTVAPGVEGISLFIVPKYLLDAEGNIGERNDVVLAGLNHKMGYRGTVNTLLNFGEGRHRPSAANGAVGYLVGAPGSGLKQMFHMMNEARIGVGLGAAALGYTGYLHALDYARSRPQGRLPGRRDPEAPQVPIIRHPDVKRMLLAQKSYVEGGLALALYSARLVDEQNTAEDEVDGLQATLLLDLLTPITKSWTSQWCLAANDLAIQVHGGYGYTREYNVEQFYRDNRLNAIHEGTHGVQGLDLLGRKVAQHGGASMRLLEARVLQTAVRAQEDVRLRVYGEELRQAWRRLVALTQQLYQVEDVVLRLANASVYLELFGHIVVAWLWLDQACAAAHGAGADEEFYEGKMKACQYFFNWELPRTSAMFQILECVDATCYSMPEQSF
jgi:alkylation response protein AidB-like acyl-CoA dehydrogenase